MASIVATPGEGGTVTIGATDDLVIINPTFTPPPAGNVIIDLPAAPADGFETRLYFTKDTNFTFAAGDSVFGVPFVGVNAGTSFALAFSSAAGFAGWYYMR